MGMCTGLAGINTDPDRCLILKESLEALFFYDGRC